MPRAAAFALHTFADLAFTYAAIVAVFAALMYEPLMAELMP